MSTDAESGSRPALGPSASSCPTDDVGDPRSGGLGEGRSSAEGSRRAFLRTLAGLGAGALLGAPGLVSARVGRVSGRSSTERGGGGRTRRILSGGTGATASQRTLPTRVIPASGEEIPVVGFGSTKAVLASPEEGIEPVANVVRTLLSDGGRVVDTSPRTPEIDRVFGRVLQDPEVQDRIFLAAKIFTRGEEEGVAQMQQNETLLAGGEPLDLVQVESLLDLDVHWPNLLRWKEEGRTRYVGATVFLQRNHDRLEEFMRSESPDFVHMNYSVMEPQAEERLLPLARDRGMAVIINRPFMNGEYFGLTGGRDLPEWTRDFGCETWAQFSLKYILANPAVTCVLTETTNPDHMEENIGAAFGRLPTEAERRRMREVVQAF